MTKIPYNHKMPDHWLKVKEALNEAMKVEFDIDKEDDRDVVYFNLDTTISHLLFHLLSEFYEYMGTITESWGELSPGETYEIVEKMKEYFQKYIEDDITFTMGKKYEKFKKETFGKFYEYFESLWT